MSERVSRHNCVHEGDLVSLSWRISRQNQVRSKFRTRRVVLVIGIGFRGASLRMCL